MFTVRGQLFVQILRAKRLCNGEKKKEKPNSFVRISIGETVLAETKIVPRTRDPWWDEYYLLDVCHHGDTLDLQVIGEKGDETTDLGVLNIPLERLVKGEEVEGEYHLTIDGVKNRGRIFFKVMLFVIDDLDKGSFVENCYFEQRSNCEVTLSTDETSVFEYLEKASEFIYVSGFCASQSYLTLKDLLISKAKEGVKVLVLFHEGDVDENSMNDLFRSQVYCAKLRDAMSHANHVTITCDTPGRYVKRRVASFYGHCSGGASRIQAKIEGAATLDIKQHFEELWRKDSPQHIDAIFHLDGSKFDLTHKYHGPDKWNCQLFRNVTDNSVLFTTPSRKQILTRQKSTLCENTLQKALIHHIRRSKRFIYLETPYLIRGDHVTITSPTSNWNNNLIPVEIAMRIADSIRTGKEFVGYVVLPVNSISKLKDPDSEFGDESLEVLRVMYRVIQEALTEVNSEKEPADYLVFLSVNRGTEISPCAVFDDQYLLLGIPGVGKGRSELGIGAYQTNNKLQEVSSFRKSLLSGCISQGADLWENDAALPSTLQGIRNEARDNWSKYHEEQLPLNVVISPYQENREGFISLNADDKNEKCDNDKTDNDNENILNSDDDVSPVYTVVQSGPDEHLINGELASDTADATPVVENSQPVVEDSQPVVENSQPVVEDSQPVVENSQPAVEDSQPVVENSQPVVENSQPVVEDSRPVVENSQPVVETLELSL